MATVLNTIFKLKRGIASRWAEVNPILQQGEPGFVIDLNRLKIGDGITAWNDLPYLDNEQLLADNETIIIENNTIKLKGFIEAQAGAQLCKNANGELAWVIPSTETIDGLTTAVTALKTEMLDVQSDVDLLKSIVVSSSEGANSLVDRVHTLEHQVNETGEGTVDALIDHKINDFATKISDDGTINTVKELIDYVAAHGPEVGTILGDINTLQQLVGEKSVETQILENNNILKTEADKKFLSKTEGKDKFLSKKYEITSTPIGALVDYREKEIRVMCPKNTQWVHQTVGATGDANIYYMGFKAYAPEGAVGFKEGDRGEIVDQMHDFSGPFAGIDSYGRKYSIIWLALARYDATTDAWTYYGANSTVNKYIGWTYVVEWYNADGVIIESDKIKINLSNESCHNTIDPYYLANTVQTIKINDTILNAINHQIDLKLSDDFSVEKDGTIGIKQISWDNIVPGETTLILDGGDAAFNG